MTSPQKESCEMSTEHSDERIGVLFATRDDTELVSIAEQLGYESVWAAEGQGKTAFGKLERWATVTERIQLATGIVNVFSRTPATVAQATATLDAHSNGRAILGLGVAHPGVIEGFHGVPFERPLPRLAEYIRLIRWYLRGEGEAFDGQFFTPRRTSFWDAFVPERPAVPIYNGALGPANVRLTGQYADGWLPNLYPESAFAEAKSWLRTGAKRANRDPNEIDTAMYVLCAVHDDPAVAQRAAATHVAYYLREIPGYYDRVLVDGGFETEVKAAQSAPTLDAAGERLGSEAISRLAVVGTPEEATRQLTAIREMGVSLPIVRAPTGTDREWIERTLETFSPTV